MRALGLETVTSVTGGRRMMLSGKPEAAFDRVALEISGYYLLGFRSEAADRDGKAHEIKVAVTRKGVEVRARKMFAYTADAATSDKDATESVNRMLRSATTETGIPMSVATYSLVEPASGAPQMRVLITAEIDRAATKEAPFTVGYTLTDGAGRNAGAAVEQVTLKPAVGHPDGPLVYTAAALVPPGIYTLRVAAADGARRLGSVAHGFEARPTDAGTAKLSELVVFDPYVCGGRQAAALGLGNRDRTVDVLFGGVHRRSGAGQGDGASRTGRRRRFRRRARPRRSTFSSRIAPDACV